MAKKKGITPKRKRLSRKTRLAVGGKWIKEYKGKNLIKGYSKWFGVDKLCAITELRMLGKEICEEYEKQVKKVLEDLAKARKQKKEEKQEWNNLEKDPWSDEAFAYMVGYSPNGVPFGIPQEEMADIKN